MVEMGVLPQYLIDKYVIKNKINTVKAAVLSTHIKNSIIEKSQGFNSGDILYNL